MTFELPPTAFSFLLFSFLSSRSLTPRRGSQENKGRPLPLSSPYPSVERSSHLSHLRKADGPCFSSSRYWSSAPGRCSRRELGVSSPTQPTLAGKKLYSLGMTGVKYWIFMALLKQESTPEGKVRKIRSRYLSLPPASRAGVSLMDNGLLSLLLVSKVWGRGSAQVERQAIKNFIALPETLSLSGTMPTSIIKQNEIFDIFVESN